MNMAIDLHLRSLDARRTQLEESQLARSVLRIIADDVRGVVQSYQQDVSSVEAMIQQAATSATAGFASSLQSATSSDQSSTSSSNSQSSSSNSGSSNSGSTGDQFATNQRRNQHIVTKFWCDNEQLVFTDLIHEFLEFRRLVNDNGNHKVIRLFNVDRKPGNGGSVDGDRSGATGNLRESISTANRLSRLLRIEEYQSNLQTTR